MAILYLDVNELVLQNESGFCDRVYTWARVRCLTRGTPNDSLLQSLFAKQSPSALTSLQKHVGPTCLNSKKWARLKIIPWTLHSGIQICGTQTTYGPTILNSNVGPHRTGPYISNLNFGGSHFLRPVFFCFFHFPNSNSSAAITRHCRKLTFPNSIFSPP
jgi:hypothetical protein